MDEKNQQLRQRLNTIWQAQDFTAFLKALPDKKPHVIKKGTIIFNEGDPVNRLYFIIDGYLKLYRVSEEGRDSTSYLLGPGYVLGIRALTSEDECAKHNAQALTNVTSHKEYFDLLSKHPEFLVDLLHVFIDRLNYTERKLEGFMLTDATARVAYFLLDTNQRFNSKNSQPVTLPLKLTHQLIADFVGSFRETVTLSLKKLEGEKIITNNKGLITIFNINKLKRYSYGS